MSYIGIINVLLIFFASIVSAFYSRALARVVSIIDYSVAVSVSSDDILSRLTPDSDSSDAIYYVAEVLSDRQSVLHD